MLIQKAIWNVELLLGYYYHIINSLNLRNNYFNYFARLKQLRSS